MNPRRRGSLVTATGILFAAVVYLIAAGLTVGPEGHQLRPLFEGIGPSAPYRWVNAPAAFKATNAPPVPVSESIDLTSTGTAVEPAGSGDGQLAMTLPAGAIPAAAGRTSVSISVKPVDPAKLGPLPPGLFSNGNAYLVTAAYDPGNVPIRVAAQPIDAILRTPVSAAAVLVSTDGKTWSRIPYQHIPTQAAVATTFTTFGYLLAAANVVVVTRSPSSNAGIVLVVGLGIAAVLLLAAAVIWRGDRRSGPGHDGPA